MFEMYNCFHKSTTAFRIDNNKKCFLITKSAY